MAIKQHAIFILRRVVRPALLDWVITIILLGIAAALYVVHPYKRPFSITNPAISLPYLEDTISVGTLIAIAVVVPAVIILLLCIFIVGSAPTKQDKLSLRQRWKFVILDLHQAWLGLAVSIVFSLLLTQLLKNLFGKHRPDFLARCNPDLPNYSKYLVGGYTSETLEGTSQLVNWQICIGKNGTGVGTSQFLDGFRSFPSGHCTIAFAGLAYLSFIIYAKTKRFLISNVTSIEDDPAISKAVLVLFAVFVPILGASYIASTRFTDNKHAGFDIIFGSVEGVVCAYIASKWFYSRLNVVYRRSTLGAALPDTFSSGALIAQRRSTDLERNTELRDMDPTATVNRSDKIQGALV